MKKKIFYILSIFILTSCGFSPMYVGKEKLDYNILIDSQEGERLINNFIIDEIKRLSNTESKNKITIKIDTSFNKIVLSKDSRGSVTDYEIEMVTNFEIKNKDKVNIINFRDKQDIKNNSNLFEQKNYEDIIKKNFAILAVNKLNLALLNY